MIEERETERNNFPLETFRTIAQIEHNKICANMFLNLDVTDVMLTGY